MWQVGIALHYSSLSTLLWIGVSARVIYKEAVWRMPRQMDGESPAPPTQRPMLRSVNEQATTHLHPLPVPRDACLLSIQILTYAGVLSGWPPKLWTMKGAHCGQQPMCLLFLRKPWRDITEWCCKTQKSYKPRWTHGREGMYETNITEGRSL